VGKDYPSSEIVKNYISVIESLWREDEKNILNEISQITDLKFKKSSITCYVVGRCTSFKNPLTLPVIVTNPTYFIDRLVHELIHILFTQEGNFDQARIGWKYIQTTFNKESTKTQVHIPLYAIHTHIYLKLFTHSRLHRDIKNRWHQKEFRRAWQIVQHVGHEKILDKFTSRF